MKKQYKIYTGILIIGIAVGYIISRPTQQAITTSAHQHIEESKIWTCSMHPQIQRDGPGNCPLCGMELIPLESDESDEGDDASAFTVKLSKTAMKIAEVEMTTIEKKAPYKEIYLPGKVMADERKITELTSRFAGRIEKLFINFTGQKVRKGQVLAKIYSPKLVTAQKELLEAVKFKETNPSYYKASRNKLKLWDLSEKQISKIEASREVAFYFDVLSPITGTVTIRYVALGDYVKEGSALFEVTDLRRVWVIFDAYESDIPWIKLGDKIKFKIRSIPGTAFESTVTFIDPVLDPTSRVAGVRAELSNPKGLLKPQMLASGLLKTMLPGSADRLLVPKSAVLWTGKKAVVYVATGDHNNMFLFREIELGAEAGEYYIVESGLEEGEMIASNGVFKIDAAAQLKGKRSMMNPSGRKVSTGHDHGGTGNKKKVITKNEDNKSMSTAKGAMKIDKSVDKIFVKQLTEVYLSHLDLQNAFLASDPGKVKPSAPQITDALKKVDMSLLNGSMHNHWMEGLKAMNKSLDRIKTTDDIESQRLAYADFNETLYAAIKMFGIASQTVYYQFCPMARNGNGAYWLSPDKEIKNPFYGDAMLTCGKIKEVIN